MPRIYGRPWPAAGFALALCLLVGLPPAAAPAQTAPYFSPTYAASEGSPYSDVYARTFGAGAPPLETSAPPASPPPPGPVAAENDSPVVYVIDNGRLLTYRAEDYASGSGEAEAQVPLPKLNPAYPLTPPEVRMPTIADRLYGAPAQEAPPLETAGGAPGAPRPLQLVPPAN